MLLHKELLLMSFRGLGQMKGYLVYTMTKPFQLLYTRSSLHIRIVSSSNSSHACGLIACVALRAVLKVGIWAARAVDTDVS